MRRPGDPGNAQARPHLIAMLRLWNLDNAQAWPRPGASLGPAPSDRGAMVPWPGAFGNLWGAGWCLPVSGLMVVCGR